MGENKPEFEQEEANVRQTSVGNISAQRVEIHQGYATHVQASHDVTIRQGGAKEVRAQSVTIRQGVGVTVDADNVQMVQGAAGLVRASDAHVGPGSSSAAVVADTVKLEQSATKFVLARDSVEMDQSGTGILVGQHITAKDCGAVLMIANSVEGNVSVVMDRQTAIGFGAAFGAALGLMLAVFGILRRKK
jgi:hypothetical protein